MITLSASALHRAEKCPASATLPRVERLTAAGERGTELHADEAARLPEGAEVAFALNMETMRARELGHNLGREYGELTANEIAGSTDRLTVETDRVVIRDYKSGFGFQVAQPAKNLQLGFYAVAAASVHGKDAARVEIEYLDQDGRVVAADFDAFDLVTLRERLRAVWRAVNEPTPKIVTGDHCSMCPCLPHCPAYIELACAFDGGLWPTIMPTEGLTAPRVAEGWHRLKTAKRLLGEIERTYRGFAALWPVPLGDGKVLGERISQREELDGRVTFNVLRDMHGPEVAERAVEWTATKTALEAAIGTVAPRGEKAALVRRALSAIAEANGITVKRTQRVEEYQGGE